MFSFATATVLRTTTTTTLTRASSLSSLRGMSTTKVTVLGASGGIGQPLSMLLKLSPYITELACYDIAHTPGVAADLSHVRTLII